MLLNIVFLIYLFYRDTLTERDSTRKESYERKRVRHFVVRRFLNQTFYTGEDGTKLHQYQLPYKTMLPLQIFVPRNLGTPPETRRELSPSCLRSGGDSEKSWSRKRVVWSGVEDVIQPESTEFRVRRLVSPARDLARDVQRTWRKTCKTAPQSALLNIWLVGRCWLICCIRDCDNSSCRKTNQNFIISINWYSEVSV